MSDTAAPLPRPSSTLTWVFRGWIVFMVLANAYSIYGIVEDIIDMVTHYDPQWKDGMWWILPSLIASGALTILALVPVWFNRRLGLWAVWLIWVATSGVLAFIGGSAALIGVGAIGPTVLTILAFMRWDAMR